MPNSMQPCSNSAQLIKETWAWDQAMKVIAQPVQGGCFSRRGRRAARGL